MKKKPATGPAAPALAPEIRPGQSVELLKELHILTREGKLNQDSRRKLKQVYHLFQFIEKILQELQASKAGEGGLTLADHGAGKSYLGFIIYDLYFKALKTGHIYGIETRAELVQKSRELAARLGFDRMSFLNLSVADATQSGELPARIDVVTALHACDTATDDAIAFGLQKHAKVMVLVPCCQAEVARTLNAGKALSSDPHAAGRALAPPAAHARDGQPDHQRAALPVPGGVRLPGHGDRTGRLGAQPEERTHHREIHRSEKAQRRRAPARDPGAVRDRVAAGDAVQIA